MSLSSRVLNMRETPKNPPEIVAAAQKAMKALTA